MRHAVSIPLLALALAASTAACADPQPNRATPSPTSGPPALRPASSTYSFDGTTWTFSVAVEPRGLPTKVVMEWGEGQGFDHRLPMADDVTATGQVTVATNDLPADEAICFRFVASNAAGTDSEDGACTPERPSLPAPSPTASA